MPKPAFVRPQQKAKTPSPSVPRAKNASDSSSPSEEGEGMEGKLLEEVEYGTKSKRSAKPKGSKATTPKSAAEKKKLGRPSLPPVPVDEEIQVVEPVEKKVPTKTVVRRVGSFDVVIKKASTKAAVVYKNRKLLNGQCQGRSKSKDEKSPEASDAIDGSQASSREGSEEESSPKVSSSKRAPVVKGDKKTQSISSASSSPSTPTNQAGNDKKGKADQSSPATSVSVGEVGDDEILLAASPKEKETASRDSLVASQRPSRAAKSQGSKRMAELAAYNMDEVDVEEGGSAGVLLDALDDAEFVKDTNQSKRAEPGSQEPRAEEHAMGDDEASSGYQVGRPGAAHRTPGARLQPAKTTTVVESLPSGSDRHATKNEEKVASSKSTAADVEMGETDVAPPSSPVSGTSGTRRKTTELSEVDRDDHKAKKQKTEEPSSPAEDVDSKMADPVPSSTPASSKAISKKPKTAKIQSKATTAATAKQKRRGTVPAPVPELQTDETTTTYDKDLILRMIVAKLESSKTCDWNELSAGLKKEGIGAGMAKKGKKGDQPRVTGDQLYELYHNVVLPALKSGKALWKDEASSVSSPESEAIVTPEMEDFDLPDDLESEEEEAVPVSTRSRPSKGKQ